MVGGERGLYVFMCGFMFVWRPGVDISGAQIPEVSIVYLPQNPRTESKASHKISKCSTELYSQPSCWPLFSCDRVLLCCPG